MFCHAFCAGHGPCKGRVHVTKSPPTKLALYIIYFTLYHSVIWDIYLEYQWAFHACFFIFLFCVVEQENEKAEVLCKVPLKHCKLKVMTAMSAIPSEGWQKICARAT